MLEPATRPTDQPSIASAPNDPGEAPLAAPPADGALHGFDSAARTSFKALNRWFMVPVQRAGLGAWLGSPIGGWMLLLRVRGRRSGLVRETPLSYLVAEGSIWVIAGFGPDTQWYRNLLANPDVEVVLPGRRVRASATEVRTAAVRARIIPVLVRATGLPSLLAGLNPWRASDERILEALDFVPLIRIDPADGPIEAGPDDPGGSGWLWRQGLVAAATLASGVVILRCRRAVRGRGQLPS